VYVQPRYELLEAVEAVQQGQDAGFAELKEMMKTLLDTVVKLDKRVQSLEERQSKSTISKSTMMGLLPELPIMALAEFEKFDGDLASNANISLAFVSTIQTNFENILEQILSSFRICTLTTLGLQDHQIT
jgi:hypothetical protein